MLQALYTAALGMMPRLTRLEVTANNIANLSTPGYKREALFQRALIEARQNLFHVPGDVEAADVPITSLTDYRPGPLQKTGNPLDVALDGPGFFVVEDALGRLFVTRRGRFLLRADGMVVTPEGKRVLGVGGMPLQLLQERVSPGEGSWTSEALVEISAEGELRYRSLPVGTFWIVTVPPEMLQRADGVEFALLPNASLQSLSPGEYRLMQGYVESANVNAVEELIQLIELQRQFEIGQRVIRVSDSTLERSIGIARMV